MENITMDQSIEDKADNKKHGKEQIKTRNI